MNTRRLIDTYVRILCEQADDASGKTREEKIAELEKKRTDIFSIGILATLGVNGGGLELEDELIDILMRSHDPKDSDIDEFQNLLNALNRVNWNIKDENNQLGFKDFSTLTNMKFVFVKNYNDYFSSSKISDSDIDSDIDIVLKLNNYDSLDLNSILNPYFLYKMLILDRDYPSNLIDKLSKNDNYMVRNEIARRDDITMYQAKNIIESTGSATHDSNVRIILCYNKNFNENIANDDELLETLVNDPDPRVKNSLLEIGNMPDKIYKALLQDNNGMVLCNMALRGKLKGPLSDSMIKNILNNCESVEYLKKFVKRASLLPTRLLSLAAHHKNPYVRYAVLSRKDLPIEIIEELKQTDDTDWVKRKAREQLKLRSI